MSNTKHTPGPWGFKHSLSKEAFNVVGTQIGGNYKIARCPYLVTDHEQLNKKEKEEAEANAKLIAAAPELLEVLEECEDYFDKRADADYADEYIANSEMKLLTIVRNVIKKATE